MYLCVWVVHLDYTHFISSVYFDSIPAKGIRDLCMN